METFIEISGILALTAVVSFIVRFLKQPLIVGYIATGFIVGPNVLNIFQAHHEVELFSKIGITILLFIVGLSLSPQVVKDLGKVSLATGIGQIVITTLAGFGIAIFLGLSKVAALYTAIALTFSSTIIIIKLLSDKRDLHKLYGQIAIGFLLVQDVIATIILIFISTLQSNGGGDPFIEISMALMKGVLIITVLLVTSSYILPRLYKSIADNQELMFVVSLAWGLGLAGLFQILGFSVEIGALVAGVALASTPYAYEVGAKLKPLRDFFITLFFVLLGANLVVDNLAALVVPTLVLSLFVLIGNPIIMILIMNVLGYTRRTSFQTGMAVAQISEFSLILAAIGLQIGHLSKEVVSIITLVALITIALSSYLILYSEKIYEKLEPYLGWLEIRKGNNHKDKEHKEYEVILFGYNRIGHDFVNAFEDMGKKFVVVDFNPAAIEKLIERQIPYIYGDADDTEFLDDLNLHEVSLCVSSIPDAKTNGLIVEKLSLANPKAVSLILAQTESETKMLYDKGASYVIVPHHLSAHFATRLLKKYGLSKREYNAEKSKHLGYLEKRSAREHQATQADEKKD